MCVESDDDDGDRGGEDRKKLSKHSSFVCVRAEIFPYVQKYSTHFFRTL